MDIQQMIFTAIRNRLKQSYDVYDGFLPPEGTAYPFIYIGENMLINTPVKNGTRGEIEQTVHVYGNDPRKRGTISTILAAVRNACGQTADSLGIICSSVSQQILPDNTTNEPLLHGIITASFRF